MAAASSDLHQEHYQLAWLPFRGETAEETILALEDLFREHGPPLVIKSDNGSAFVAAIFRELLRSWRIEPLFSPPRHPQYNGALERSNGTLKTYTHLHAARQGHPFRREKQRGQDSFRFRRGG